MSDHSAPRQGGKIVDIIKFSILALAFLGLGLLWPGMMFIAYIAWPIPVIWLAYRYSWSAAAFSLGLALLMVFLLSGDPMASTSFIIQAAVVIVLCALLFRKAEKYPYQKGLPMLLGGCSAVALAGMAADKLIFGVNVLQIGESKEDFVDEILSVYQQAGVLSGNTDQAAALLQSVWQWMGWLMPALTVIWTMMEVLLIFLLCREIFRAREKDIYYVPNYTKLRITRWEIIWSFIIGLSLLLIGDTLDIRVLMIIGCNILLIFAAVFLFTGFSTLISIFRLIRIPKLIKLIVIVIMVLYFPATMLFMVMLGLFDPVIDFRRLYSPKNKNKPPDTKQS